MSIFPEGSKVKIKFVLFLLGVVLVLNVFAQSIKFYGKAIPGGLIVAKAPGVVLATLNGDTLKIDKRGYFVFGFDRDDKGKFLLKVKFRNNKTVFKRFVLPKRKYKIQRINRLKKRYVTPPKRDWKRIAKERKIKKEKRRLIGKIDTAYFAAGFVRPVKGGRISSLFGSQRILNGVPKSPHNGLDIALPKGTPVYAMSDGIVRQTANNFYFSGNFVLIDHGQGLSSVYLHLSKICVHEGDFVRKGEKIGEVGSTGRATGPHLHWGVMWKNKRIDPASVLKINLGK